MEKCWFTDENTFRIDKIKVIKSITNPRRYSKKVKLWGGICQGGKITLKIFTNIMDSVYYIEILNSKLSEIKKAVGKDKKLMFYNNPKYKYNWDRNKKIIVSTSPTLSWIKSNRKYMANNGKKNKLKGYYDSVRFYRSSKSRIWWNRSRSNKNFA